MGKNTRAHLIQVLLLSVLLLSLNSCIGLSMDIQMRRDGSGRLNMEYRISRMAESLGRFDGNENLPIIPVGRADWERTIARNQGLRLVSFSSNENTQDTVIKVTIEYADTESLLKFLDPSGTKASLSRENQSGRFNLILNEPAASEYNDDLLELMRNASKGYNFSMSFTAERNSTLTLTDGAGNAMPNPAAVEIVPSGRRVSFSIGITEILNLTEGLGVNISW